MIRLVEVPASKVEPVWTRLDAPFEDACNHSRGTFTKGSIFQRASTGDCQIWIVANDATEVTAACVTSIVSFPGGMKALLVEAIAGECKFDIFEFRGTLEARAKEIGCNTVLFFIPRSWAKKLPDYKITHYVMCKELLSDG